MLFLHMKWLIYRALNLKLDEFCEWTKLNNSPDDSSFWIFVLVGQVLLNSVTVILICKNYSVVCRHWLTYINMKSNKKPEGENITSCLKLIHRALLHFLPHDLTLLFLALWFNTFSSDLIWCDHHLSSICKSNIWERATILFSSINVALDLQLLNFSPTFKGYCSSLRILWVLLRKQLWFMHLIILLWLFENK